MKDNVKLVLDSILERFKSGDIPQAVAYSMFPIPDIPSAKWSILNRTIMFLSGTQDARGYRQWQQVNRYVKKGSKCFYILVPYIKKVETDEGDKNALYGFGCKGVFPVESTDGEELSYEGIELPKLPLMERAEEWGISVKAIPGSYCYSGSYSPVRKEISLCTKEESVFFHELAHCSHEKVIGKLKMGQDPLQEIVAELSAHALCRIVGKSGEKFIGNCFKYIEMYSQKIKMSPYSACIKVMNDVEKVLNLILHGDRDDYQSVDKIAA